MNNAETHNKGANEMKLIEWLVEFIYTKLLIGACVAVVVYSLPSIIAEGVARGLFNF